MNNELKGFIIRRRDKAMKQASEMKYHSGGNAESGRLQAYAEAMNDVLQFIEYRENHPAK